MPTIRRKQSLGAISHDSLRSAAFFKDRDPAFLAKVTEYLQLEIVQAGSDILTMGAVGDKMYFLHFGEVEILVGPELISVAKLGPGNVFGEMAMFGQGKRTATVRATEFCDCRVIRHSHFQAILKLFPKERRYFEKLAAERTKELQKVQQQALEQRRPRLNSRWLSGFFQTLNPESSKDDSASVPSSPNSPTRRHSITGVRTLCRSNTNTQPQRRHSVGSYVRSKSEKFSEKMPSSPGGQQSNQHDSQEPQSPLLPTAVDFQRSDYLSDEETKVDSEEEFSSGCLSGQTSGSNSPRAPMPVARRMPGLLEALQCKDPHHAEDMAASQDMRQEESGEQHSEAPDSLAMLTSSELYTGAKESGDSLAMLTSSELYTGAKESGSRSPERNQLKAQRPARPPACVPSPGYVRRLSNIRRAKTLDESKKVASDETMNLQGVVLPIIAPIQHAKRRPKTTDQAALGLDEMESIALSTHSQSPSNNAFSLAGRSVFTRRTSHGLLDKMKLDNAMLSKGVQQLSRSIVQ